MKVCERCRDASSAPIAARAAGRSEVTRPQPVASAAAASHAARSRRGSADAGPRDCEVPHRIGCYFFFVGLAAGFLQDLRATLALALRAETLRLTARLGALAALRAGFFAAGAPSAGAAAATAGFSGPVFGAVVATPMLRSSEATCSDGCAP